MGEYTIRKIEIDTPILISRPENLKYIKSQEPPWDF